MQILRRLKRVMVITITLLFIINSITPRVALASPTNLQAQSKADFKMTITGRLKQLCVSNNSYIDDRGLVYSLMSLCNCSMWLSLATGAKDLGFGATEFDSYTFYLTTTIAKFNSNYKTTTDKLSRTCSIEQPNFSSDVVSTSNKLRLNVYNSLVDVCTYEYNKLIKEYNSLTSDSDKESFLTKQDNHAVILAVYRSCTRVEEECQDIMSLINLSKELNRGTSYDISSLVSIIQKKEYAPLVEYARKIIEAEISSMEDDSDMNGDNAYARYLSEYDGKNLVNSHWLKVVACSAIYRPFESKTGESEFITSLKYLDESKEAESTYKGIYKRKKPLYKREYTKDEKGSGEATRITLRQFLNDIKNGESGVLVSIEGQFGKSTDSDAFAYYQDGGTKTYDDNGEVISDDDKDDEDKDDEDKDDEDKDEDKKEEEEQKNEDGGKDNNKEVTTSDDNDEIVEMETLTDESVMSPAVFTYSQKSPRASTNLTLLHNILQDSKAVESINNADSRLLYVNPFGDVVLDDDTVVVPAAANATYYSDSDGICYNPNTAAFMNFYPKISLNSEYFQMSDREKKKYIVTMVYSEDVEEGEQATDENLGQASIGPTTICDSEAVAYLTDDTGKGIKEVQIGNDTMPIELSMYNSGQSKIPTMKAFNFKFSEDGFLGGLWAFLDDLKQDSASRAIIAPDTSTLITYSNQSPIFPLTRNNDDDTTSTLTQDYLDKCKTLVSQFYNEMRFDSSGENVNLNERYNREYYTDIFKLGYDGSANVASFVKNAAETYDNQEEESAITKWLKGLTKTTQSTLGQNSGVIGLQDAHEDKIFGTALYYFTDFKWFIITATALIFVWFYARRRMNLITACFSLVATVCLSYLMITEIPTNLPHFLNGFINNSSDDVAYRALFMKQERYQNPFVNRSGYDDLGNFTLGTSSIVLYRLHDADIDALTSELKIDKDKLLSGTSYVIDENSGLFIQGNSIKINLDRFLAGVSIVGGYDRNASFNGYYGWESRKYISNVIDYYMPYYQICDAFITKLNKTSALYNIPSSTLSYANNIHKDSFIVNAYVKSDLFIHPNELEYLKTSCGENVYQQAIEPNYFGSNNVDLLGIRDVIVKDIPSNFDKVRDTLWFQTMVREGYFTPDGEIADTKLIEELITKVNINTQKFLIDNINQMPYISDENLIKITGLFATIMFNEKISTFTDVVYPQALDYEQFKMEDVFLPILTKDYDRYIAQNQNLIDYVYADFDILGLIFFDIMCVECFLITMIMKFSLPIMYLALLLVLVFRMCLRSSEPLGVAVKGYIKIFGLVFLGYCCFCWVTTSAYKFNTTTLTLFALVIAYLIILSLMFTMVWALITNLADFGNTKVNLLTSKLLDKFIKKLRLENMITRGKEVFQKISPWKTATSAAALASDRYKRYSYTTGFDDIYGDRIQAGVMHQGYEDFDYNPPREKQQFDKKRLRRSKVEYVYRQDDNDTEDQHPEDDPMQRFRY